ncbi:LamG-like jellyroll fold domain-containing protein [Maribellus sediminis]|uniref:LamG-like jellyroll fold domain-containing protein n=1 Tax=Maribellus sediminis TaxID=2696285 RepID=UPI00142F6B93|nr:LamG-like jellyroll fold domain-containing protein [Maribellus sediminis]
MKGSNLIKLLLILVLIQVSGNIYSQGFTHPGLLHTREDFDRIKTQLAANNPAVVAGYNNLKNSEWAQLGAGTWPSEIIKRGVAGDENYINAARGAHIAYMCALRWKISGDVAYANKAVDVLNSWAVTTKGISGNSNYALASGIYGYEFANAGELLRDYEGWKPEDFKKFQDWMQGVWYPVALGFLKDRNGTNPGHYWSNWGLSNALTILSIGVVCDDIFIYNQGLSYYKHDYIGTFKEDKTGDDHLENDGYNEFIGNLVPIVWEDERGPFGQLGQMQESGRDQGHTLMAVGLATDICQTALNQGEDLFAYMDNRLAAGIEYVAAYNTEVENADLPWKNYWYHDVRTAVENSWVQTANNEGGREQLRPYWDRILGYYEGIKGITMNYSGIMGQRTRAANGGADIGGIGSTSGGYDHLGYSTLTCTRPAVTPDQAPTSLGNTILYDGTIYQSSALLYVQPGSSLKLIPTLPDGETNTGNWLWDSGATTQELEITVDSSHIYRISYTNSKGIVSTQMFSISVYGDCKPDIYTYSISSSNGVSQDTIQTVKQNSKVILSLSSSSGRSSYLWNTGETSGNKEAFISKKDTAFSITATNQGGAKVSMNFHIRVEPLGASFRIGNADLMYGEKILAVKGDTLTLMPTVKPGSEGGTWLWSDGTATQNLTQESVQNNSEITVTYTNKDSVFSLTYSIIVVQNRSSFAYWPLDENTGSVVHDIWAGNNGEMSSNVWTGDGAKHGGIKLNGDASSYVKLGDDLFGSLNDFTISVWVKPEALDTWARIWDFGTNTDYNMFLTAKAGDGYIRFAIKAGGSEQQITTTKTLALNKWTHIAVTKLGNKATMYINGIMVGSNTGVTLNPSDLGYTAQNYIGKSQWPDPLFIGNIDELQIYNSAFSHEEIKELIQNVEPYEYSYSLDGGTVEKDSIIPVIAGQNIELKPILKSGMEIVKELENITWQWNTGETTQSILVNNLQKDQKISVIYTHNGTEYSLKYSIIVRPGENALAYWPMDENDGTLAYDIWGGNIGKINSGVWTDQGKYDSGIKFDGTANSYIRLPDNFTSTLNDFTISVWVKPDALDTWARVWDFGSNTNYNMFLTAKAADGYVRFAIKAGGSEQQTTTTKTLTINKWTHIAVTKSGNTAKMYIDGILAGSNTATTLNPSSLGNTTQNYVGKSQWPDPLFKGTIDELRIYKTSMSQTEITELYTGTTNTGISIEKLIESEINVYPTISSTGDFTLRTDGGPVNITVYTLTGKVVKQFSTSHSSTKFKLRESQMYIVRVSSTKTVKSFKIIKN